MTAQELQILARLLPSRIEQAWDLYSSEETSIESFLNRTIDRMSSR
jgi:hypothetical protein